MKIAQRFSAGGPRGPYRSSPARDDRLINPTSARHNRIDSCVPVGTRRVCIALMRTGETVGYYRLSDSRRSFNPGHYTRRDYPQAARLEIRWINVSAIVAGVSATAIPASFSAAIFPAAVPFPPETIAPA